MKLTKQDRAVLTPRFLAKIGDERVYEYKVVATDDSSQSRIFLVKAVSAREAVFGALDRVSLDDHEVSSLGAAGGEAAFVLDGQQLVNALGSGASLRRLASF